MITVSVECKSGNSWTTCINATFKEAVSYYLHREFTFENDKGEETKEFCIGVELITLKGA